MGTLLGEAGCEDEDRRTCWRNENRLIEKAVGIETTIVNGEVLVERGAHTGALPGTVMGNGNGSALQAAA